MEYPIDASLTTNGFSIGLNSVLSDVDINFIGKTYQDSLSSRSILFSGQRLSQGEYLRSANKRFQLILRSDGKLVIYKITDPSVNGQIIWSVDGGKTIVSFAMLSNGNAVLYQSGNSVPHWSSGTSTYSNGYLVLGNDGNLVIYQNGIARWTTGLTTTGTTAITGTL